MTSFIWAANSNILFADVGPSISKRLGYSQTRSHVPILRRRRKTQAFLALHQDQTDFERTPPKSALHVAPEKILEKKMRSLIADRLKEAGFKVQTIAKTDLPGPEEIKIAGLTYWDGRIFICKK